jgi:hypothetical protein
MFRKKNCFYSGGEVDVLDRNNELFALKDNKLSMVRNNQLSFIKDNQPHIVRNNQSSSTNDIQLFRVVNLLSTAIIRHEMRLRSKKERIINKNDEERTGLLRTAGQNRREFTNNCNEETL